MAAPVETCYRHPDRRAGVTCQRCGKPICPSCMVQASVGFHCPDCAKGGRQRVYTARTIAQIDRPVVTQVLIGINVAVYLLGLGQGGGLGGGLFNGTLGRFGIDFGLVGSAVDVKAGRFVSVGVGEGEWYRLITGGFLHAGLLHLAMNMAALWFLGSVLEKALGRVRFAVVYGACLLGGSLGVMLVSPHDITVGASGAIFGLLGVMVVAQRAHGMDIWQSGLGGLLVINLLLTFAIPSISVGGHVGGLATGFVCGAVTYRLAPRKQGVLATFLCGAIGVACFAAALAAAVSSA